MVVFVEKKNMFVFFQKKTVFTPTLVLRTFSLERNVFQVDEICAQGLKRSWWQVVLDLWFVCLIWNGCSKFLLPPDEILCAIKLVPRCSFYTQASFECMKCKPIIEAIPSKISPLLKPLNLSKRQFQVFKSLVFSCSFANYSKPSIIRHNRPSANYGG